MQWLKSVSHTDVFSHKNNLVREASQTLGIPLNRNNRAPPNRSAGA
ncbi:MAG: hypothetical protein BWY09_02365 [Candidatus Hydrogenedentes bacterium ADurb.Bin179]|nr:MAG: hypothetical protein BWY09_02365 [Candidatus Hydrogenedentes bacterium ADurb.Bin179]